MRFVPLTCLLLLLVGCGDHNEQPCNQSACSQQCQQNFSSPGQCVGDLCVCGDEAGDDGEQTEIEPDEELSELPDEPTCETYCPMMCGPYWSCYNGCVCGDPFPEVDVEVSDPMEFEYPDPDLIDAEDDFGPGYEYRYVRIDDLSPSAETATGGADIDAIILFKGGPTWYADIVEYYEHGGALGGELDPIEVLGEPDAFMDYPDLEFCDADAGFLSLGGLGGSVIVHMGGPIEAGDTLSVLEVGGCDYGGGTAIAEDVEVMISVGRDPVVSQWVVLGNGAGPEISLTVPTLPPVYP